MNINTSITTLTFEDLWHLVQRNGKSRVKPFDFLPFIVLPLMMRFAFSSPGCTILVMAVIAVGVALSYAMFQNNRSQFFFAWTLASGLYLFVQFEFYNLLYMTQLEHMAVVLLVLGALWCLCKTRISTESEVAGTIVQNSLANSNYCRTCQTSSNERFFHCIWLDCCLSRANYIYFFAGQVLAVLALLVSSNLGLTNACHSYLTIGGILLPDNCTYAYSRYLTAKIFALSAYALGFMCVILLSLIHQIVILIPKYYLSSTDIISNTFHKEPPRRN